MDSKLVPNSPTITLMDMTTSRVQVTSRKYPVNEKNEEPAFRENLYRNKCTSGSDPPFETFPVARNGRRVVLNVGGERHEVTWETLNRFPTTRLGKLRECKTHDELMKLCDDYSPEDNEYYFNWQATSFGRVLQYYRTGRLHATGIGCSLGFEEDLQYWGLDDSSVSSCCQSQHLQDMETLKETMKNRFISLQALEEEEFESDGCSRAQKYIWDMFEKPESSRKARVLRFVSISAIVMMCIITMNSLVNDNCNALFIVLQSPRTQAIPELVCVSWLTVEYLIRLISAPKKCKFLTGVLNIIDLLFILQYIVSFALMEVQGQWSILKDIVCNFRVMMILKLARHLKGFRILGQTLRKSSKELGMLLLFLLIGIMTFSSIYFLVEYERDHMSDSSTALWWATVAMITSNVCSADACPKTLYGKLIAAACVLCGVVVITFPIPIIMNNFGECYKMQKMQEITLKQRKVFARQRCKNE